MDRRITKAISCGRVLIGSQAPVSIQSMTTTDTRDPQKTALQILELDREGCDIVRVAVPDMTAAEAIFDIKERIGDIPLVCDIHFDGRLAIRAIEAGADKIRINPGNIGSEDRVRAVVETAKERNIPIRVGGNIGGKEKLRPVVKAAAQRGIPIRVGVNGGSLEKDILSRYGKVTAEGLAESAMRNVRLLEEMDFDQIVISVKSSDIMMNYDAHRILSQMTDYPFHIGITESGTIHTGALKSAAGLGALLLSGMGDTLRISLTGDPVREVRLAKALLKACGLRPEGVTVISCPTCGRCSVELEPIALEVEKRCENIRRPMKIAVMGCEVNGPGEAREADLGLAFGKGRAALFQEGKILKTLPAQNAVEELMRLVEKKNHEND